MNNINMNISGWIPAHPYKKFDTVFFSGNGTRNVTGCFPSDSGYYYCETAHTSSNENTAKASNNAPTGLASKWTQEFFFKPGYNSSVVFQGVNNRIDFGDGYFSLVPKSTNNIKASYNLSFEGRTDREAKAIANFLESHSFEPLSGAVSGFTGFVFQPFYPYNQKSEHFCDSYGLENRFNNVNDIRAEFINEHNSSTKWLDRFIPTGNTQGVPWEAGQTYSIYDTVYHSGGVLGTLSGSDGYYFYTGESSTTSSTSNGPVGKNTLWTNHDFFFKPSVVTNSSVPIRFSKTSFNNDFTQRFNDGINTANLKLNVILEGRSNKEAVAISQFLLNKQAYHSFKFTPPAPHDKKLNFICESWRHSYIFDDNHTIEVQLEQNPLDFSRKARVFKTAILSEKNEILAPYPADGEDTVGIDFGDFMTGFSSGTGLFLMNSGEQTIKSTLSLSGIQAAKGLYKFADLGDSRISNYSERSLTYKLNAGDSGRFEIIFSTTGHTGQIGGNAGLGASPGSAATMNVSFHKGRIMYTDEPQVGGVKYSALTVSTVDEFLFDDPSGILKIDLSGEAVHDKAPGIPTSLKVAQVPGALAITGSWGLSDPATATGISVAYSTEPNETIFQMVSNPRPQKGWIKVSDTQYLATGMPTGTTEFRHEPVTPDTNYYYKVTASNMDIVGVGTSVERTFATCAYHENYAACPTGAVVTEKAPITVNVDSPDHILYHVNISGEAQKALSDLGSSNFDNYSGIHFIIGDDTKIVSTDPLIPALDTGEILTKTDGATRLKLRIILGKNAQIIGAGGKGADAQSQTDGSFAYSRQLTPSARPGATADALTISQTSLGVCHELQGTGPLATQAMSGLTEGNYLLPGGDGAVATNTEPINGENGGVALGVRGGYAGQEIEISNDDGYIVGGGGGGGQGGVRWSNLIGLLDQKEGDERKFNSYLKNKTVRIDGGTSHSFIELRAGGAGGGGAGFRANDAEGGKLETAAGGKRCPTVLRYKNKAIETSDYGLWLGTFSVINSRSSQNGENSQIGLVTDLNKSVKRASHGGDGAVKTMVNSERGEIATTNVSCTRVKWASDSEYQRNAGGVGGAGGGFGVDGQNGEHPQHGMPERNGLQDGVTPIGAEPRNYGYGGSGGLCIETSGCDLRFLSSNNIPSSGLSIAGGHRTATDAKSSELYRNTIGIGQYLTARNSGAANVKEVDDPRTLGYMSGIHNNGPNESQYVIATEESYPAWKAFNQEIHPTSAGGAATTVDGRADYCSFTGGAWALYGHPEFNVEPGLYTTFPYYLVYDFGLGNSETVQSYSIASVGADLKYYQNWLQKKYAMEKSHAPSEWELQATNISNGQNRGGEPTHDKDWDILDKQVSSPVLQSTSAHGMQIISHLPHNIGSPAQEWKDDLTTKDISVPGLIRSYPIVNATAYRYYRLKIIRADKQSGYGRETVPNDHTQPDIGYGAKGLFGRHANCRIADFGLRGKNNSYAGFVSIRNKFI